MPSLTYGLELGFPKICWLFVSFSVKRSGTSPSTYNQRSPNSADEAAMMRVPAGPDSCRSTGLGESGHQVQVLRNQRLGSRWSVAGSGPRFETEILIRISSGVSLAYSTYTSK